MIQGPGLPKIRHWIDGARDVISDTRIWFLLVAAVGKTRTSTRKKGGENSLALDFFFSPRRTSSSEENEWKFDTGCSSLASSPHTKPSSVVTRTVIVAACTVTGKACHFGCCSTGELVGWCTETSNPPSILYLLASKSPLYLLPIGGLENHICMAGRTRAHQL